MRRDFCCQQLDSGLESQTWNLDFGDDNFRFFDIKWYELLNLEELLQTEISQQYDRLSNRNEHQQIGPVKKSISNQNSTKMECSSTTSSE